MDFDYAHYMLTEARKGKENPAVSSPSREAYRKQLAETFNMNRTRILAFKNKPPTPMETVLSDCSSSVAHQPKPKARRYIPQVVNLFLIDLKFCFEFLFLLICMLTFFFGL